MKKNNNREAAKINTTQFYPVFAAVVNAFLLVCLAGMVVFNGFKQAGKGLPRILIIVLFLWILNLGFSVFASPVVLRYQVFPILVSFALAILAAENIYKLGIQEDINSKKQVV